MDKENNIQVENDNKIEKETKDSKKKKNRWIYLLLLLLFLAIIIIILLLLKNCGSDSKYKIKIHYDDSVIEVDENFKLSDFDVEGGKASFLVNSDGNIVKPDDKLDPKKEYSVHVIPEDKEKVKVTYKFGDEQLVVEYQKGAGLLFPKTPTKDSHVFIGWRHDGKDTYANFMDPVNEDMILVAQFEEIKVEDGKCKLNCDVNNDGECDLNCDLDGDGIPDINIDSDNDGKCDELCREPNIINVSKSFNRVFNWTCSMHDDKRLYLSDIDRTELVRATIDGKEIKPLEDVDKLSFDISDYFGTGKTYKLIIKIIKEDRVGHKYFITVNVSLVFEGDCVVEEEYTCPEGFTLTGTQCTKRLESTIRRAKVSNYRCPSGYDLNGDKCTIEISPTCPDDSKESPTGCMKTIEEGAKYRCNSEVVELTYSNGECLDPGGNPSGISPEAYCDSGYQLILNVCTKKVTVEKSCSYGTVAKNTSAGLRCEQTIEATPSYTCADYGPEFVFQSPYMCVKKNYQIIDATKK